MPFSNIFLFLINNFVLSPSRPSLNPRRLEWLKVSVNVEGRGGV
jgi:hypothetical protein